MYLVNERIDKQSFSSLGEECEDHVKDHATLCNVSVSGLYLPDVLPRCQFT